MKTIILIVFLLLCPLILGYGSVEIYSSIKKLIKKAGPSSNESAFSRITLYFPTGAILLIIVTGMVNILTIYLNLSVGTAVKIFAIALIALTTLCYFFMVINIFISRLRNIDTSSRKNSPKSLSDTPVLILGIVSVLLAAAELVYIAVGKNISISGDPTLETVVSFLSTDHPYSVDPLTGLAFTNGYPSRMTLQCLPMLYAILARAFSVSPSILLWHIIPVLWAVCAYCCFYRLSKILFTEKSRQLVFFIICTFLLLCNDLGSGTAGFGILCKGYAAGTVLSVLLIIWTVIVSLKGDYPAAILTIAAEPLTTSLQFGIGACLVTVVCIFIISRLPFMKDKKGGKNGTA